MLRDHPRACGAHDDFFFKGNRKLGSSPRMRGSPDGVPIYYCENGIIPAHAGLTAVLHHDLQGRWDHPRACGAHVQSLCCVGRSGGSSPRMRGSHFRRLSSCSAFGIIPAHAGLTFSKCRGIRADWDHPRACGAHPPLYETMRLNMGSSPRMRGSLVKRQ